MKPRSWASTRRGGAPPVWQPEALVILVGAFGLLAWLLDVDVLKSISPNWSAMRANEAFSFVLVGVALMLLRTPSGRLPRYVGYALAAAAGLTGLATIAEYAFGSDLQIDELLFHEAKSARRLRPAEVGAVAMSVVATLTILSYLFSAPVEATGFSGQVMRVGPHTAITFLVLSAAILMARPGTAIAKLMASPFAGGTLLRRLLPTAALIVPTVGWIRLKGEEAGLYNFRVGLGVMVTSAITLLAIAVFVTGRSLERTDVERRRVLDEVRARTEELEAANKELDAFSYSVSHDLRAPLRAIDGFSRILETEFAPALEPAGRRYLHLVSDNARAMGRLIDGLLAFSRLGQQALSKRPIGVERLLGEAIAEVQPLIGARTVEISRRGLPAVVEADPTLLKQVFEPRTMRARVSASRSSPGSSDATVAGSGPRPSPIAAPRSSSRSTGP